MKSLFLGRSLKNPIIQTMTGVIGKNMKQQFIRPARLPRAAYDQNRDIKESIMRVSLPIQRRWCSKHPTSVWKQGFAQCFEGYIKEEKCEVGK